MLHLSAFGIAFFFFFFFDKRLRALNSDFNVDLGQKKIFVMRLVLCLAVWRYIACDNYNLFQSSQFSWLQSTKFDNENSFVGDIVIYIFSTIFLNYENVLLKKKKNGEIFRIDKLSFKTHVNNHHMVTLRLFEFKISSKIIFLRYKFLKDFAFNMESHTFSY